MKRTRASESVGTPLQRAGRYRHCRTARNTASSSSGPAPLRTNALCTCPSDPTMKLTRTGASSSSAGNSGSGVSNASGGRTFPHLGSANGSETGLNSEICAGTRRRWRSDSASRARSGFTRTGTTGVHQAATHKETTQLTRAKQAKTPPPRVRECPHRDKTGTIRLSDVSILKFPDEGLRFLIPFSCRHTGAVQSWQFNLQSAWSIKCSVINNL